MPLERSSGAIETGIHAIARGLDKPTAIALDRCGDDPVVVGEEPFPSLVAEALGQGRRADDVGEHERREDPLATGRLAEVE